MSDSASPATLESGALTVSATSTVQPDELILIANGFVFSGWEDVQLTLRTEGFPSGFSVQASVPISEDWPVEAGQSCVVKLGNDTVLTGYIDRVRDYGDASSHMMEITGRGKTQDLVDCGAEWTSHQMVGGNAFIIAQRLAAVYGIETVLVNGADPGPDIPSFVLNFGDTAADIIQRVARNAGLLAYEDHLGRLALANAGSTVASSGIAWGTNVEAWSTQKSMDQRFSDYLVATQSIDSMGIMAGADYYHEQSDPNVPRHRLTYIVMEPVATDPYAFANQRALWEAARRVGRSYVVTATVDSWRDSARTLWGPNILVPVTLPGTKKGENLLISEVTFRKSSGTGTTAELTCMPKGAFQPEPIVLSPINTLALQEVPK